MFPTLYPTYNGTHAMYRIHLYVTDTSMMHGNICITMFILEALICIVIYLVNELPLDKFIISPFLHILQGDIGVCSPYLTLKVPPKYEFI